MWLIFIWTPAKEIEVGLAGVKNRALDVWLHDPIVVMISNGLYAIKHHFPRDDLMPFGHEVTGRSQPEKRQKAGAVHGCLKPGFEKFELRTKKVHGGGRTIFEPHLQ